MEKFTFDDWIEGNFLLQKDILGSPVLNDSERYLYMCENQMELETLNKIQDAQEQAYEYAVKYTLEMNERYFRIHFKKALDLQTAIELEINKIESFIKDNQHIYDLVVKGKTHRGIKVGAKFMTPKMYLAAKQNSSIDLLMLHTGLERIWVSGKEIELPTEEQLIYPKMEMYFYWVRLLRDKVKGIDNGRTLGTLTPKSSNEKPSYLTYLLQLYYEKNCKLISTPMLLQFSNDNNLNLNELKKRLAKLELINISNGKYKASDNKNNAQAFIRSYEYLLAYFKSANAIALEAVKNDYTSLKNLYPEYIL